MGVKLIHHNSFQPQVAHKQLSAAQLSTAQYQKLNCRAAHIHKWVKKNDRVLPKLILFGEEHDVLILQVVQTGLAFLQLSCHAICNFEHVNRKITNRLKSAIKKMIQFEREREGGRGKQTDGSLRLHTKI